MSKSIDKIISKNSIGKCNQKLLDNAQKIDTDALTTDLKIVVQKLAEPTGNLKGKSFWIVLPLNHYTYATKKYI